MDTLLFKIEVQGLSDQVREIGRLKLELEQLAQKKKDLKKEYADGSLSIDKYRRSIGELVLKVKANKDQTRELEKATYATAAAFKGAEGSMVRLSHELGLNRDKYRALSQAERENDQIGGKLLRTIQQQDTEIKKLDASIGNHQRNVGHYENALSGLQGILTSLPGGLGQVGSAMLSMSNTASKASEATGGLNKAMILGAAALGGVVMAGGALISFLKSSSDEAINQEKENAKLLYSLNGNVEAYDNMLHLRERLLNNTTFNEDEINSAINYSVSLGRTEDQTKKLITASMGLSKVTGKDLQSAMQMLVGTYEGSLRGLGKYAGELKNLTEEQLRAGAGVDLLNEKFGRFATSDLSATSGMLGQVSKYFTEIKETIGFMVLPVVNNLAKAFLSLTSGIRSVIEEPMSETLTKEHNDVLRLVGSITSLNEKSDLRKRLLDELITKYPSLFGNLDKEKTKNKDLAAMIDTVNLAYEKRIKLAVYGEDLAKLEKEGQEIFRSQRDNLEEIDAAYSKYVTSGNKAASVIEKIAALRKASISVEQTLDAETGAKIQTEISGMDIANTLYNKYLNLQAKQILNQRESLKITQQQQALQPAETTGNAIPGAAHSGKSPDKVIDEAEKKLEKFKENIGTNAIYIQELANRSVVAMANAMLAGVEQEKALASQKIEDAKRKVQEESEVKISGIEDLQKYYLFDLDKYYELEDQKQQIKKNTDALILSLEDQKQRELANIEKKYTVEGFDEIKKNIEKEAQLKIDAVKVAYETKGRLSKQQQRQLDNELHQIQLEALKQEYDALKRNIEDKKKLGQQSLEADEKQLADIVQRTAELKAGITTGQTTSQTRGAGMVTGGLATLLGIGNDESAQLLSSVQSFLSQVGQLYIQAQQDRINAELKNETKKLEKQKTQELKDLETKRKKGLITEAKYEEEKEKIDQKYEAATLQLQKEAFEKNKKLQIASALMSGAGAVINALNTQPFWLGIVMAALASILVGIQVANIKSQEFVGARGGLIDGKSHAEGGVTFTSGQSRIELEGGEGVINKRTMQSKDIVSVTGTPRQIASKINSMNGYGVSFASGGFIGSRTVPRWAAGGIAPAPVPAGTTIDMEKFARMIIEGVTTGVTKGVNDKRVYVVETDVTEVQNRVKVIESGAKW